MTEYTEISHTGSVLSPKRQDVNEIFLASYGLGSYSGCEFGCPYCDGWAFSQRPLNASIYIDPNRPNHLARELASIPKSEVIGLSLGEPYQPIERRYRITRQILQILAEQRRSVVVITKSPVVCEDISILQTIHQQAFAIVVISLVTFDLSLFQHLENIAPSPDERLKAVNTLKQAGIACGIALIPIFPFLTDKEIYLSQMFERLQSVHPDFVVWDSLWIHKGRHHDRIQKILKSLDNDLIYRYKRLYRNIRQPSVHYRRHLDQRLLDFCNQYKLAPRIPENLYEHFLPGKIVKKLRQKNHQFLNQNNLS